MRLGSGERDRGGIVTQSPTIMKNLFTILLALLFSVCLVRSSFAQDPVKLKPDTYKVILNNDKVRVLDIRLKAGDKSPMHSHPDLVIYAIKGGKAKFTDEKGKATDATMKSGECQFRKAEKHSVENTGKSDIHVLNIELKR